MDPISSPRTSHFRVLLVLLLIALAGFVAGLVAFADFSRIDEPSSAPADPVETSGGVADSKPAGSGGVVSDEIGPVDSTEEIEQLSRETEQIRGLKFLTPVQVTFLDEAAFRDRLREDVEAELDEAELLKVERIWQALGVIGVDTSLEDALLGALDAGVLAFYDPVTDELVMRGLELDPFTRGTLVHELTHALDDQHFDLDRFGEDQVDDEAEAAFSYLVEGTAVWVEEEWVDRLPAAEQAERLRLEAGFASGMSIDGLPEVLLIELSLPYLLGPRFVDALVGRSGTDGIDAAYLTPPTSGSHIVDVDGYLAGEAPIDVPPPPAGGEVLATEVVGATGWYSLMLATAPGQAQSVAELWAGDSLVLWQDGPDRWCVRVDVMVRSAGDLGLIVKALATFAMQHGEAAISEFENGVRLDACG